MKIRIAKSELLCRQCGKPITIGAEYVRDSDIGTMHAQCHAAMEARQKELAEGGKARTSGNYNQGRVIRSTKPMT